MRSAADYHVAPDTTSASPSPRVDGQARASSPEASAIRRTRPRAVLRGSAAVSGGVSAPAPPTIVCRIGQLRRATCAWPIPFRRAPPSRSRLTRVVRLHVRAGVTCAAILRWRGCVGFRLVSGVGLYPVLRRHDDIVMITPASAHEQRAAEHESAAELSHSYGCTRHAFAVRSLHRRAPRSVWQSNRAQAKYVPAAHSRRQLCP
jgi:hypothetical protein